MSLLLLFRPSAEAAPAVAVVDRVIRFREPRVLRYREPKPTRGTS